MTTVIDYALMAGGSYISTRDEVNRFPVPDGWTAIRHENPQDGSGFEAISFIKGADIAHSSEIVISFAGTDSSDVRGDIATDLALAAGVLSEQLKQAADYYLQVKASAPAGTKISFTGHSLGGGLAALMAVFFGESAYTFDQAPFLQSARVFVTTDYFGNPVATSVAQGLRAYLAGRVSDPDTKLANLDAYISAADPNNPNPNPADTLAARGAQVSNINTQGEFLSSWFGVPSSNRIGSQENINNSNGGVSGLDLHSQALLTAFLQSRQTAESNKALGDVTFKLPDLLRMIFDKKLFAFDTDTKNTTDENFLERLVKHEAGVRNHATNAITLPADAMVTRFTTDLWKLTPGDGVTPSAVTLTDALIAFAMQKYYEEKTGRLGQGETLFNGVAGGVRFDTAAVVGEGNSITTAKGYKQFFIDHLETETIFTVAERNLIKQKIADLRDWSVAVGNSGMTATDTNNRGSFMLGGDGADDLTGGTANDLLVGGANADTLTGGAGDDRLLGGSGTDIYKFTAGSGKDDIIDSDGFGQLELDGQALSGGMAAIKPNVWEDKDRKITYTFIGNDEIVEFGRLVIEGDDLAGGRITIENFDLGIAKSQGFLGIKLDRKPEIEIKTALGANVFADQDHAVVQDGSTNLNEGFGKALAVDLSTGAKAGDKLRLALAGGSAADYALVTGDETISFANGAIEIELQEGQTQVSFAFLNTRDVDTDALLNLTATLIEPGNSNPITNTLAINFDATDESQGPQTSITITGDINPIDTDTSEEGIQAEGDAFGNTVGTSEPYSDILHGTAGNDHILSGDLNDDIGGRAGDDWIEGGAGNDYIHGEEGDDLIEGGTGSDILSGEAGNDRLYANARIDNATAIANGNNDIGSGQKGDWLSGNEGDDVLIAGKLLRSTHKNGQKRVFAADEYLNETCWRMAA